MINESHAACAECMYITTLLTSSLKKSVFYNWLINNILYLCVPSFWGTQKIF